MKPVDIQTHKPARERALFHFACAQSAPSRSRKRRQSSRRKSIRFLPLPQMVPDITNLQLDTYAPWGSLGGGGGPLRGADGLEQELQERLQPTPAKCWLPLHPLLLWGWGKRSSWGHIIMAGDTLSWLGTRYFGIARSHRAQTGSKQRLIPAGSLEMPLEESKFTASCKVISFWLCPSSN